MRQSKLSKPDEIMRAVLKSIISGSQGPRASIIKQIYQSMSTSRLVTPESLESTARSRPYTIVVEGNIGSGKTTFLTPFVNNHSDKVNKSVI